MPSEIIKQYCEEIRKVEHEDVSSRVASRYFMWDYESYKATHHLGDYLNLAIIRYLDEQYKKNTCAKCLKQNYEISN